MPFQSLLSLLSAFRGLAFAFIEIEPILPCTHDDHVGSIQVEVFDTVKNAAVVFSHVTITAHDGSKVEDYTDQTGWTLAHRAPVGTYDVIAVCPWHLPDPFVAQQVQVQEGQLATIRLVLQELRFRLHVDADRDGTVDDAPCRDAPWSWGPDGSGAIVFCNDDDDDASGTADNSDNFINGVADLTDIAPIEVRRDGSALDPPNSWEMTLTLSRPDAVRLFGARAANAQEIAGPAGTAAYVRTLQGAIDRTFGLEAVHHAGTIADEPFDGVVAVVLGVRRYSDPDHQPLVTDWRYTATARFRVAPWLMTHHSMPVATVFVTDLGNNNLAYRQSLGQMVQTAGAQLVEVDRDDSWMQDCMETGYTTLPGQPPRRIAAHLNTSRPGALANFADTLRAPGVGVFAKVAPGDVTFNYGGNLEVTPPVRGTDGRAYPWGRIYYGTGQHPMSPPIDAGLAAFLDGNVVQKPFVLDPSWLVTAHVDEMITFVPAANDDELRCWKLLILSPGRAYEILDGLVGNANAIVFRDNLNWEQSVQAFVTGNTLVQSAALGRAFTGAEMRAFNDGVQLRMDAALSTIAGEIEIENADIIRVPVLFKPWSADETLAAAMTADIVNMLVVNGHCIIPDADGPKLTTRRFVDYFRDDLRRELEAAGLTCHFIDASYYHPQHGEVHCSTNVIRWPPNEAMWVQTDAARWWEFVP